jgi:hypothetical protein
MLDNPLPRPTNTLPQDEQRRATRFRKEPDTEFVVVRLLVGAELLAEVYDESLGGLGLIVADASSIAVGSEAVIVYHGDTLEATVRHVNPRSDGTFFVGCQCHAVDPACRAGSEASGVR